MMTVNIDQIRCKGCGICVAVCPKKVCVLSEKRNSYGSPMPEASEQECIGCRLCERLCPDAAIDVKENKV